MAVEHNRTGFVVNPHHSRATNVCEQDETESNRPTTCLHLAANRILFSTVRGHDRSSRFGIFVKQSSAVVNNSAI